MKKPSLVLLVVLGFNIGWTAIVLLASLIYFSSSGDSFEGAGFLLAFTALPTSFLASFVSGKLQIVAMALCGYLQWNIIGFLVGKLITRLANQSEPK